MKKIYIYNLMENIMIWKDGYEKVMYIQTINFKGVVNPLCRSWQL